MKHRDRGTTRIFCDSCFKTLRIDCQLDSITKKVILKESVSHLGNGRHKCKSCFNKGLKSKWKVNLNPLKKERVLK